MYVFECLCERKQIASENKIVVLESVCVRERECVLREKKSGDLLC